PRALRAAARTGTLGSTTAGEVVGVLRSLSVEQGVTVIVVTHAEEVARHAARRVGLRDGRVVGSVAAPGVESAPAAGEAVTEVLDSYVADEPGEDPPRARRR